MQIDRNQVTSTFAELLHTQVFKFAAVFGDHLVGNVLRLVATWTFKVFFVYVMFAESVDYLHVGVE